MKRSDLKNIFQQIQIGGRNILCKTTEDKLRESCPQTSLAQNFLQVEEKTLRNTNRGDSDAKTTTVAMK